MMYCNKKVRCAAASVKGGEKAPALHGEIKFFQRNSNVLVSVRIVGLPQDNPSGFYGFHIHSGESCEGEDFSATGGHYNPQSQRHPSHKGDMPPLLSFSGNACMKFVTDRFTVGEIIGKTVVIHQMPDDFTTQPSGNSGDKIACGVIRPISCRSF
ncbi:MAG: superoxide dismutase family protein [Clostridia bacterium]|nr:superoxide dismutase family protein [Clostridia bacterium]